MLQLSRQDWQTFGSISVIGHAFLRDEILVGASLAQHFLETENSTFFLKKLAEIDGQFAIIFQKSNEEIWLGSDRLRHFPLFFYGKMGDWQVFDRADDFFSKNKNAQIDADSDIFLKTNFCLGSKTLIQNLHQTQAGEAVFLKKNAPFESRFYADFWVENMVGEDANNGLEIRIRTVFKRQLKRLDSRFLAIPLTGGFDSRLIATMVREAGIPPEKVLCFTYGRRGNLEFAPAKKVAQLLGFQYISIEYDQLPLLNWLKTSEFETWISTGGQLATMPFLQDFPALFFLKKNQLVPPDTVFLSGHSGDFLAGSHLEPRMNRRATKAEVLNWIFEKHFPKSSLFEKKIALEKIAEFFPADTNFSKNSWLYFENFDLRERQSKYIIRSAEIFRHFGFDYVTPLWDAELISFFQSLPFEQKLHKSLYNNVLQNYFFKKYALDFTTDLQESANQLAWQGAKNWLKTQLPRAVNQFFVQKNDYFCYREMVDFLISEAGREHFKTPNPPNDYSRLLSQWYFWKTKNR
jgi:asparagine synthase (glutamine-hydrolysing)